MCQCTMLIFRSLLLLQLLLICVSSAKISFKDIFLKEHIEDNLLLLGPKALLNNFNQSDVSDKCAQDLAAYKQGIRRQEPWALQMIDSSSKIPSGILYGNIIDLGIYDECIKVNQKNVKEGSEIHGQHCMYSVDHMIISSERKFPFNPLLSICLPAKCNSDDLIRLINNSIDSSSTLKNLGLSISYASCTKPSVLNLDKELIIFAIIMGLYIGFLSLCTILEMWYSTPTTGKHSRTIQTLSQFSFLNNSKAIFNMNFNDGDLPPLHGIRALNTFWLIIVHEYMFHILTPLTNFLDLEEWYSSWTFLIPMVGLYSVETFFVLSGFLTAFAFFKERQKNYKFNIFYHYLHRIFRLAPSVVAVLYITLVLIPKIPLISSGPRLDWLLNIFVSRCNTKWPSVLFFYQNFFEKDNFCLQQLWSVTVDVQLMWISPFILYSLHKTPKVGLAIFTTLFIFSITSYVAILGINKHSAIYFTQNHSINATLQAYEDMYEMPYTRASPWLLGILLGYIIQGKRLNPNTITYCLGWLATVVSFIFCVIGIKTFTNENYEYNIIWEMTFIALSKPLWGFIICWIIYISINYPNEPLIKIFSSKIFLPFSRLSYSLCIVHLLFPLLQVGATHSPKYFNDYIVFQSYISNVVLSSITAYFFSIIFEIPMRNLEKLIFNEKKIILENKRKIN